MVLSYLGEAVYLEAVVAVLVALVAVGGRAAGEDRGDGRFEGSLVDGRGSEAEAHGGDEGEQGGELHGVVGRCGQSEVQAETAWSTASKADGNANEGAWRFKMCNWWSSERGWRSWRSREVHKKWQFEAGV
jgi:hypothetical protein